MEIILTHNGNNFMIDPETSYQELSGDLKEFFARCGYRFEGELKGLSKQALELSHRL